MEKTDVVEIYSRDGEVHLILNEHKNDELSRKSADFNLVEIKDLMKKDAAKPLLLMRG